MDDNWHYATTDERSYGPVSFNELERILSRDPDAPNFIVWRPGMSDWARAKDITELQHLYRQRPPPLKISTRDSLGFRASAPLASKSPNVGSVSSSFAVYPWRRFFARFFDLYAFTLVFFFFLGIAFPALFSSSTTSGAKSSDYLYNFIAMAGYVVFETFCMHIFGTSAGKTLYGIRVARSAGDSLSFPISLQRALAVWARGLGLGIPFVTLITLIVGYRTLKHKGRTSWDHDFNCVVTHDNVSLGRWFAIGVSWAALISIYAFLIAAGSS